FFFFSSRRRHTRFSRDWSSDVCSSDLRISDVIEGQLGEVGKDLVGRHALRDHADDRGDRYPGATHARHAAHDPMIDGDALESHGPRLGPTSLPGLATGFESAITAGSDC